MRSTTRASNTNKTNNHTHHPTRWTQESLASVRTTARDYTNPVDYRHPYPSMARLADHLATHLDLKRIWSLLDLPTEREG